MNFQTADRHVDAVGLKCPEPLMLVRNMVRDNSICPH